MSSDEHGVCRGSRLGHRSISGVTDREKLSIDLARIVKQTRGNAIARGGTTHHHVISICACFIDLKCARRWDRFVVDFNRGKIVVRVSAGTAQMVSPALEGLWADGDVLIESSALASVVLRKFPTSTV